MEFIVDYSNKKDDLESNLETKNIDLESKINNIKHANENDDDEDLETNDNIENTNVEDNDSEEVIITTKKNKRIPSKRQLEALKISRGKATKKIKENKIIREKLLKEKEKEEAGDLQHIKEKMEYYQRILMEKQKSKENVNAYYNPEIIVHKMSTLDYQIDKMFE